MSKPIPWLTCVWNTNNKMRSAADNKTSTPNKSMSGRTKSCGAVISSNILTGSNHGCMNTFSGETSTPRNGRTAPIVSTSKTATLVIRKSKKVSWLRRLAPTWNHISLKHLQRLNWCDEFILAIYAFDSAVLICSEVLLNRRIRFAYHFSESLCCWWLKSGHKTSVKYIST